MSKSSKKKAKVPKITEEEYMKYISSLKEESLQSPLNLPTDRQTEVGEEKNFDLR